MLRLVRIPDPQKVVNSYPHELSGGMQQTGHDRHGIGLQTTIC